MRGTCLLYSSHNRSDFLHDHYIVQRALRGRDNKRILFLPMSALPRNGDEYERQDYEWGTFRWFFDFYERYGLEVVPFFWSSQLRDEDLHLLWKYLYESEVVLLGGGHSRTGMWRYKHLGDRHGEWGKFGRILHERQARGLLTVGFSAGADQLSEHLAAHASARGVDTDGFGLARNVVVRMHHEAADNGELAAMAGSLPHCMAFGLPNDSGLYLDQGRLQTGSHWQVIEFVTDQSWDLPRDGWHIKTRHGAGIEHVGPRGHHFTFRGGDRLVRVQSEDGRFDEAWVQAPGARLLHLGTYSPSRFDSIEDVLASH
jgi:peptidase E